MQTSISVKLKKLPKGICVLVEETVLEFHQIYKLFSGALFLALLYSTISTSRSSSLTHPAEVYSPLSDSPALFSYKLFSSVHQESSRHSKN